MEKKNGFLNQWKCYILLVGILVACFAIVGVKNYIAENTVLYVAGTYEGHGTGIYGGDITVIITVDKNTITDVTVTHENETEGIGGKEAIEDGTFASQILEAQGSEIDGVSGATVTSNGVRTALAEALAQATAGVQ